MSARLKKTTTFLILIFISLIVVQCTKENFVEPIDPFQIQKLDPNPEVFKLGKGDNAIILKANKVGVIDTKTGKKIKGSLYVENEKYGDIRLSNGDFELIQDTSLSKNYDDGLYFSGFKGEAIITLPEEGFLSNLTVPGLTAAPIGFKKGSEFDTDNYSWPVNEDRYYFYYENLNPLPVNISNSSLENIKKIAIDPTDPFFFISGDINGTPLGDLSDVGVAISVQGKIPFNPKVEIDEYPMESFNGNLYIAGNIPFEKYPASFTGESVLSFSSDNNEDGNLFFDGKSADFVFGLNGTINFEHDALDWLGISVELGSSTTEFYMNRNGETKLRWAGIKEDPKVSDLIKQIIGKDYDFLDYLKPSEERIVFYGQIGNVLSDWEMGFKMESYLKIPNLINGGEYSIDMGHCYLFVNKDRMTFDGMATLAGFTHVGLKGNVEFSNGNFVLTGYVKNGFTASAGKLSIGYDLSMDITLENYNGNVSFEANAKLKGKACWGKLCAKITIKALVSISSKGNYKVCFSVGIGKIGFDVCIKKEVLANGGYKETMEYDEIPLEYVPVENRFDAYECN